MIVLNNFFLQILDVERGSSDSEKREGERLVSVFCIGVAAENDKMFSQSPPCPDVLLASALRHKPMPYLLNVFSFLV